MFIVIFFREQGAGSREQGAGSREQRAGSREQGAGSRERGKCCKWGKYPSPNSLYLITMKSPIK